jgi:hypothetical protein
MPFHFNCRTTGGTRSAIAGPAGLAQRGRDTDAAEPLAPKALAPKALAAERPKGASEGSESRVPEWVSVAGTDRAAEAATRRCIPPGPLQPEGEKLREGRLSSE